MPFPVLFPCHIIASVFHVCPRVQYCIAVPFLLTFFLSFRDFPQKMATALSENPASVIHSINLAHNTLDNQGTCINVSFFLLYLYLPSSLSIYLPLSVFTISVSMCYFCLWVFFCSFLSLLCCLIVLYLLLIWKCILWEVCVLRFFNVCIFV